jgi:hypothetical protein
MRTFNYPSASTIAGLLALGLNLLAPLTYMRKVIPLRDGFLGRLPRITLICTQVLLRHIILGRPINDDPIQGYL